MKVKKTGRTSGLPVSNLQTTLSVERAEIMALSLANDANGLEKRANPNDTRTRGIVRKMRRLSTWYSDVAEQRA